jgi:hypothetical protein
MSQFSMSLQMAQGTYQRADSTLRQRLPFHYLNFSLFLLYQNILMATHSLKVIMAIILLILFQIIFCNLSC